MSTPKSERLTITISRELSKNLAKALASIRKSRSNIKVSRSELVREILTCFVTANEPRSNKERTYEIIIEESMEYERGGIEAMAQGSHERAKKMFLLAAAREMEALAIAERPDESVIRSALIHTVILLKDGTEYSHLPDIPARKQKTINCIA